MIRHFFILSVLFCSAVCLRADLVLEQKMIAADHSKVLTVKLHGQKMRMDEADNGISVIVDLDSRDSITLLTNKTFVNKFGQEVRADMEEERKRNHGTNELDAAPSAPVDTGKTEMYDGVPTKIYLWHGAYGLTETLWVATNFPNYKAIRAELSKLDKFNVTGPHRNAQPIISALPGMVLKSKSVFKGHESTTLLNSVQLQAVDPSLFLIPPDYTIWTPEKARANSSSP